MAYSEQIKNEVKERLARGESVKQISEQTGISVSTIYNWKKEKLIQKEENNDEQEIITTSMRIKKLTKYRRFDEAIKLTEKYPLNPNIQSQRIKIAIKQGDYEEAKRIGNKEEFKNSGPIQSQMTILEEKEKGKIVTEILNQKATKLYYSKINEEDIKEIEENIEIPEFEKNVMLLAICEKYKYVAKAKRLIQDYKRENENSANNKIFNTIMQRIEKRKKNIFDYGFYDNLLHWEIDQELKQIYEQEQLNKAEEKLKLIRQRQQERLKTAGKIKDKRIIAKKRRSAHKKGNKKQEFLNKIRTKLYYDKIEEKDKEELETNTEISEFEKNAMLLAICEKHKDVAKAKRLVQHYKRENENSANNKIFNTIMQRIDNKRVKIFDYGFYDNLLHWEMDQELRRIYEKEEPNKAEEKIKLVKRNHQQEIAMARKIAESRNEKKEQKAQNPKIMATMNTKGFQEERKSFIKKIEIDHYEDAKKEIIPKKKEINYLNGIMEYLNEKKHLIYVKMQSSNIEEQKIGISEWDKMGCLIEKVNNNRDNKLYLNQLYNKISQLQEKENGIDR